MKGDITLSQNQLDKLEIINRLKNKVIDRYKAAELLDVSYRHAGRLKKAVQQYGASALIHGNKNRKSNHQIPGPERDKISKLLKEKYKDFNPAHAKDMLKDFHHINKDVKTIRNIMIEEGLYKPKKHKSKQVHLSWRDRKGCFGEMIQFDGSYHNWFGDYNDKQCLLAAIDDASSGVIKLKFAKDEGVFSVFSFWQEYIKAYGKPKSIYLDRFSTYKMSQQVAINNPDTKTQFERAMTELDINVIFAYSAEAKGRVERLFETLQDRLVKELALHNIASIDEANEFLENNFLPRFNDRFSVIPKSDINIHSKLNQDVLNRLDSIFSRQEIRIVHNDFTLAYKSYWYQLTRHQPVTICKKDKVIVEEKPNTIRFRLRDKYLNYVILPKRPNKAHITSFVLPKSSIHNKPKDNHPWRQYAVSRQ